MARSSGWKPKLDKFEQKVEAQVFNRGVCGGVIHRNVSSLSPSLDPSHW